MNFRRLLAKLLEISGRSSWEPYFLTKIGNTDSALLAKDKAILSNAIS